MGLFGDKDLKRFRTAVNDKHVQCGIAQQLVAGSQQEFVDLVHTTARELVTATRDLRSDGRLDDATSLLRDERRKIVDQDAESLWAVSIDLAMKELQVDVA